MFQLWDWYRIHTISFIIPTSSALINPTSQKRLLHFNSTQQPGKNLTTQIDIISYCSSKDEVVCTQALEKVLSDLAVTATYSMHLRVFPLPEVSSGLAEGPQPENRSLDLRQRLIFSLLPTGHDSSFENWVFVTF